MIRYLLLLVSSAFCFVFGIIKYLGRKTALFSKLVIASMGCFMLGFLYETLAVLTIGEIPSGFHVGILAQIGGFGFLFSASYAQMDGLVDDKTGSVLPYRLIALTAPAAIALIYLPVVLSGVVLSKKIMMGAVLVFVALAAYYHLKHLIIPDVSFGIISSIRHYSLCALILEIAFTVMLTAEILKADILQTVGAVIMAACCPVTCFMMEKGRKKWTA